MDKTGGTFSFLRGASHRQHTGKPFCRGDLRQKRQSRGDCPGPPAPPRLALGTVFSLFVYYAALSAISNGLKYPARGQMVCSHMGRWDPLLCSEGTLDSRGARSEVMAFPKEPPSTLTLSFRDVRTLNTGGAGPPGLDSAAEDTLCEGAQQVWEESPNLNKGPKGRLCTPLLHQSPRAQEKMESRKLTLGSLGVSAVTEQSCKGGPQQGTRLAGYRTSRVAVGQTGQRRGRWQLRKAHGLGRASKAMPPRKA